MYSNDRTVEKGKQRDKKTNLHLLDIIRHRAIDNTFKLKTRKFKKYLVKYTDGRKPFAVGPNRKQRQRKDKFVQG